MLPFSHGSRRAQPHRPLLAGRAARRLDLPVRPGQLRPDGRADQTLRNVEALLDAEGSSLDEVVSCLVHLADLADFGKMNGVDAQHFDGVRPARTTVRADLVAGMKVEITVVAHRGSSTA